MSTDPTSAETANEISPSELNSDPEDALLLDVRTPAEFTDAHIEGSISHPLASLDPKQVDALIAGGKRCFVICQSGTRARQAAAKLRAQGLSPCVLDGGIRAWDAAGLPLIRGKKTMSLERQVRIAAGTLVLAGAILGYLVHPAWIALSGFVGAGLVFAGLTDTCGMGMILARMPWNNRCETQSNSCCSSK